jgi:protein-tyrosine phosphatase
MPAAGGRLRAGFSLERVLAALARRAEPPLSRVLALAPLRRPLQRRALRAWRATDEPLIVCTGNINRSPFAAALARRRPGSRARSAGFYPEAGRPSPPATQAAASARGVDLSAHRSVVLDQAMIAGAGAIFAFDLQHLARLLARRPRAWRKLHLLGLLADGPGVLIVDPHGRQQAVLEAVLDQIAAAVERADLTPEEVGYTRPAGG